MQKIMMMMFIVTTISGCASSHTLIGKSRPPIPIEEVKIYSRPPANYEEIAILESSSKRSFSIGNQSKMDKAIERLKKEAADLGANGVLIQGVGSESSGSVYTGTSRAYGNTAYGSGVAIQAHSKTATGIAIFVSEVLQPSNNETQVTTENQTAQKLRDLLNLKNEGLISEDEYQQKRRTLIEHL